MFTFFDVMEFLRTGHNGDIIFIKNNGTFFPGFEASTNWCIANDSDVVAAYQISKTYNADEDDLDEWTQQVYDRLVDKYYDNGGL